MYITGAEMKCRQTSFYSPLLYCASQILSFFYKLKLCGNPASSKSISAIFSNSICSLHVSMAHLVIFTIFQTSSLLLYLYSNLWLVIFDTTIVIVLACHQLCSYKNVTHKCCVCSDCSTGQPFPHLSPSSWASLVPETQQYRNKAN